MAVTFSNDIMPLFNQFKGQMMWRFDLTDYEHVKANARIIYDRIADPNLLGPMPPPPSTRSPPNKSRCSASGWTKAAPRRRRGKRGRG